MIFAGAWVSTTNYVVTDVVTFNGASYIAIANNVASEPDTHPGSWTVVAAAGAAGPAGPTGPAGASGSIVTFPLTVLQGGTGATDATTARTNLAAAAAGPNSDITALTALTGVSIQAGEIQLPNNGTIFITDGVNGTLIGSNSIGMAGGGIKMDQDCVVGGDLKMSGTSYITSSVPGGQVVLGSDPGLHYTSCVVVVNDGLIIEGPVPTCAGGQIGFGASTFSTATAGGGQAVPGTVLGYLEINVQGTLAKIPYFAP